MTRQLEGRNESSFDLVTRNLTFCTILALSLGELLGHLKTTQTKQFVSEFH